MSLFKVLFKHIISKTKYSIFLRLFFVKKKINKQIQVYLNVYACIPEGKSKLTSVVFQFLPYTFNTHFKCHGTLFTIIIDTCNIKKDVHSVYKINVMKSRLYKLLQI